MKYSTGTFLMWVNGKPRPWIFAPDRIHCLEKDQDGMWRLDKFDEWRPPDLVLEPEEWL